MLDIHGPRVLGELVRWMGGRLYGTDNAACRPHRERIFRTTLHYEYLFCEAAYKKERWPDQ